jgi:hypothetical protein
MISPWSIHEAEIALYPAWRDGMPYRGPGTQRTEISPLLQCKSALSISFTPAEPAPSMNWMGMEMTSDGTWEITARFPDGAYADAVSRVLSRPSPGGFHILVVRFFDATTGHWSCFRWFYVTLGTDESSESNQIMGRSLTLRSTYMQEEVGNSSIPSMQPVVMGEVDWICGSQRITALQFNPVSETWASLPRNEIGNGGQYVSLSPPAEAPFNDITLMAYLPALVAGAQPAPALPRKSVAWADNFLFRTGNHLSALHHGLALGAGISIQALGIAEPLMRYYAAFDRGLDPTYVVFRYLRRLYATIGDGVFAVPKITYNEVPPHVHDYAFRIRPAGAVNPSTGQSGIVLLPEGAWVDGTLSTP